MENCTRAHDCGSVSLPGELIDHIISNVQAKATLKACSLVCKDWVSLAQCFLFEKISLSDATHGVKRCQQLLPVLERSPHLIPYVRRLHLSFAHQSGMQRPTRRFLLSEPTLPDLLSLTRHIRTLQLGSSPSTLKWTEIPLRLLHSLEPILQLSTFQHLTMYGWEFIEPIEIFDFISFGQRTITSMKLRRVTTPDMPYSPWITSWPTISFPNLENLEMPNTLMESMQRGLRTPNLRSLKLRLPVERSSAFSPFVEHLASSNISDLSLRMIFTQFSGETPESFECFPDLTPCVQLQRLHLRFSFYTLFHDGDLRWAIKFLDHISASTTFDVLELDMRFYPRSGELDLWKDLARALHQAWSMHAFRRASLGLILPRYHGPKDPDDPRAINYAFHGELVGNLIGGVRDAMEELQATGSFQLQLLAA
ncbi:hypothetical protein HGRIS_004449 [Hohenbuehelia grisea]|uniref:F-box domain-containing protein n=1 Tax=Hohenbuehelia grisea TaxID=104357 RepID=A0ABR3JBW7_9AGAR